MDGRLNTLSEDELKILRSKLADGRDLLARERQWLSRFVGGAFLAFPGWAGTWTSEGMSRDVAETQRQANG